MTDSEQRPGGDPVADPAATDWPARFASARGAYAGSQATAAELHVVHDDFLGCLDGQGEPALVPDVRAYLEHLSFLATLPMDWRPGAVRYGDLWEAGEQAVETLTNPAPLDVDRALFAYGMQRFAADGAQYALAESILRTTIEALPAERYVRPWLLADLADILRLENQWTEAEGALSEAEAALARQVAGAAGTPGAACRVLVVRAMLELDLGLIDRVAMTLVAARERAEEAGTPDLESAVLWAEVRLAVASEDSEGAVRLVDEWLGDREPGTDPVGAARFELLGAAARAELAVHRTAEGEHARATLNSILGSGALPPPGRRTAERILVRLDVGEGELHRARARLDPVLAELDSEREEGLSAAMEMAYTLALDAELALALGEELHGRRVRLHHAYDEFLEVWSELPRRPGGIGFLHFNQRRRVVNALIDLQASSEGALDVVWKAQAQGSLARTFEELVPQTFEGKGITEDDLAILWQHVVPESGALCIWIPGPWVTHLVVLQGGEIDVHTLPGKETFEGLLRDFGVAVGQFPADPDSKITRARLRGPGKQLVEVLFPEAVRELLRPGHQLVLVGGDLLADVPFEALPWGAGTLGTEFALSRMPSLPVAVALVRRRLARALEERDGLVVVAAPVPDEAVSKRWPGLDLIPFTAEDAGALTEGWPGPVRVWEGNEATVSRLQRAGLENASLLHILAHGAYAPERSLPAGLVLSPTGAGDDGILWPEEVQAMRVPPRVLLSSCHAGRGHERRGEDGWSHMGGAFLMAGAETVMLPTGKLEVQAELALSAAITRGLAAGLDPAEAARVARVEVSSQARWSHPFFHAQLRVYGLGDR